MKEPKARNTNIPLPEPGAGIKVYIHKKHLCYAKDLKGIIKRGGLVTRLDACDRIPSLGKDAVDLEAPLKRKVLLRYDWMIDGLIFAVTYQTAEEHAQEIDFDDYVSIMSLPVERKDLKKEAENRAREA